MRIAVIGTGYVGLVVGACFAETGNDVVCADVDERKIRSLRDNKIPIYEPGLESLVERNQAQRRLAFTTEVASAISGASPPVAMIRDTGPMPSSIFSIMPSTSPA